MLPKINNFDIHENIKRFSDIRVIGLIAFGIVVLLVSWSSLRVLQVNYELEKQETGLQQKNQIQKLENENLRLRNVYFESDEYLELSARRQLNKGLAGEKLYLVPESVAMSHTVSLPKTQQQIEIEKQQHRSKFQQNLEDWKNFFFHQDKS